MSENIFLVGRWQERSRQRKKKKRVSCVMLCVAQPALPLRARNIGLFEAVRVCWVFVWCFYLLEWCLFDLLSLRANRSVTDENSSAFQVNYRCISVRKSKCHFLWCVALIFSWCVREVLLKSRGREKNYWSGAARRGEPRGRLSCDSWKRVWSSCILVEHQPGSEPVLLASSERCVFLGLSISACPGTERNHMD